MIKIDTDLTDIIAAEVVVAVTILDVMTTEDDHSILIDLSIRTILVINLTVAINPEIVVEVIVMVVMTKVE